VGNVLVIGAGRVGRTLIDILEERKHKIWLVDENRDICNEIATEKSIIVVHGDATDPSVLDDLNLEKKDYIFAVTGSDESNFLAGVYAKQAGAKKVICRVGTRRHAKLLEKLGIESAVSEFTLASELANRAGSPMIYKLLNPMESGLELVEKEIEKKMAGKTVAEVSKEKNIVMLALYHNSKFRAAKPNEKINEGSRYVMLRSRGLIDL